jgi:hypothetical protein
VRVGFTQRRDEMSGCATGQDMKVYRFRTCSVIPISCEGLFGYFISRGLDEIKKFENFNLFGI